ncbi:MAG: serine/threonine protein kinase, partial [Deltaproteobacteria bacterium]|nr:serine/threonine protein kinase [Deltaproteobacteria bacterium]
MVGDFAIRKRAVAIPGYDLIERIGEGGSAEVWRAKHRLLGRDAAVKILRTEDAASELMRERFKLEARSAAALRCPHAVEIYDFGTADDGTLFLAMELLHGVDLQSLVERFGPQEPSRTICLLEQTCDVLHEAHSHQRVNRDIKPANIFVTRRTGQGDFARVVDFGLVRAIGCDREEPTTPLNMSGTLAFLPPEVVTAECVGECDVDGRADIYALGCVAYWLLTGKLVFDAPTPIAMAAAHATSPPSPPSSASEQSIPPELDECVLDCLAKDPAKRPQTAMSLAERLRAIVVESPWTPERAEAWWAAHL